jgi:hypothetical protein
MDRMLGGGASGSASSAGYRSSSSGNIRGEDCIQYFDSGAHLRVSAFVFVHKGFVRESGPYHVRVGCETGHIPGGAG